MNLHNGSLTKDQWQLLCTRAPDKLDDQQHVFADSMHLFCTHKEVDNHNTTTLHNLQTVEQKQLAQIHAKNTPDAAKSCRSEDAMGLTNSLKLREGCKVVLTMNLWTSTGLVNGADGTVVSMLYARNVRPPNLPIAVIVQFPNYSGSSFLQNCSHSVPIVPFKAEWQGKNNNKKHCVREQLPLRIGYADTIHHVQGKTFARWAIDLGTKEMTPSISFVVSSKMS